MKRKPTLFIVMLVPLLIAALLQAFLPYLTLYVSQVKESMAASAIEQNASLVENRSIVLENAMLDQWASLTQEADSCEASFEYFLASHDIDIDEFLAKDAYQDEYLRGMFPTAASSLMGKGCSGLFLVMANDKPTASAATYNGFCLRDSDPNPRESSSSSFLLQRGSKELAHDSQIAIGNTWKSAYSLEGEGTRECDEFFYQPYNAASSNPKKASLLGFWSQPYALDDQDGSSAQVVSYSLPLVSHGKVYAIIGCEISLSLIQSYLSTQDLGDAQNSGMVLAIRKGNAYQAVTGTGKLAQSLVDAEGIFTLDSSEGDLSSAQGSFGTDEHICAVSSSLELFSTNVPYDYTQWEIVGFVPDSSIYGPGNAVYKRVLSAIVICLFFAVIMLIALTKMVGRPVDRLTKSISGGIESIKSFKPANIREVNEIHDVVLNLAQSQAEATAKLAEETERYRIAVKSSTDLFYTYRKKDKTIEIVNSVIGIDGIHDLAAKDAPIRKFIDPDDLVAFVSAADSAQGPFDLLMHIRRTPDAPYQWYKITGNATWGDALGETVVVGSIRNIQESKELEMEMERRRYLDPVTKFLRLGFGMHKLEQAYASNWQGTLVLIDIDRFQLLNESYGFTLADFLLEELSRMMSADCEALGYDKAVLVRAGSDLLLAWIPDTKASQIADDVRDIAERFAGLVHNDRLALSFSTGIAQGSANVDAKNIVMQVRRALQAAKEKGEGNIAVYSDAIATVEPSKPFNESVSLMSTRDMDLTSFTLSLFDRSGSVSTVTDLLVLRFKGIMPFDNVVLTAYNADTATSSIVYSYEVLPQFAGLDGLWPVSAQEERLFNTEGLSEPLRPFGALEQTGHMLGRLTHGKGGCAFHMSDNNIYSGSILIFGDSIEEYAAKHQAKLKELCGIVQNRINFESHDAVARAKSEFLARMSHEIRTPMNGIIGMTQMALKENQSEQKRIECLEKVQMSSTYLLSLLNDILDMSKIESGKMQLSAHSFNLEQLLDNLEDLMGSKFKDKSQTFEIDADLTHSSFVGDELRINQVLVNLIGNANKFTQEGGLIRLEVRETPHDGESTVSFAVIDNGCGISEQDRARIFKSFEQASDNPGSSNQGTGLGLAISNKIAHLMGTSIELRSEPGRGSTFSFTAKLPWTSAKVERKALQSDETSFAGRHVLVVEDNELNLEITLSILADYGIEAQAARNGAEALDMVANAPAGSIDLVLMDIMMPVMNGLDAAKAIRRLPRADASALPIVAMSANAFDEDEKRSLAAGMNAHLSKPIDIAKFQEVLVRFLG